MCAGRRQAGRAGQAAKALPCAAHLPPTLDHTRRAPLLQYYDIPTLSIRAAAYHLMAANIDRFRVRQTACVARVAGVWCWLGGPHLGSWARQWRRPAPGCCGCRAALDDALWVSCRGAG